MPLPRYEGGATPFQQVQPMAAQAGAQFASNLSQRLSQWQDTIYKVGAEQKAEEGRNQAIQDMTSGDPLKVEKGYGFYAKAYNEVSKAAYNAEVESDLKVKAEEYASMSKSDPEQFKAMFGEYVKKTVAGIQEPEFKALALTAGQKQLGTQYASLTKEAFKNRRENDIKALQLGIDDLSKTFEVALLNDDYETTSESLAKITAMYEAKVKAGDMSADAIPYEVKKIFNAGYKAKLVDEASKGLARGEVGQHAKVRSTPHYQSLTIEERKDLDDALTGAIDRQFKSITQEYDLKNQQVEKVSKFKKEEYLGGIYLGKGLDKEKLDKDFREGMIKHEDYKEVLDQDAGLSMGGLVNIPEVELFYTMHLGQIDMNRLKDEKGLTSKRKIEFAAQDKLFRQRNREIDMWGALKSEKTMIGSHPRTAGISILNKYPMFPSNKKKDSLTKISIIRNVDSMVASDPTLAPNYMDLINQEIDNWAKHNAKVVESNNFDAAYDDYVSKKTKYDNKYNSTFSKIGRKISGSEEKYAPPSPPERPQGYIKREDR